MSGNLRTTKVHNENLVVKLTGQLFALILLDLSEAIGIADHFLCIHRFFITIQDLCSPNSFPPLISVIFA